MIYLFTFSTFSAVLQIYLFSLYFFGSKDEWDRMFLEERPSANPSYFDDMCTDALVDVSDDEM